MPRCKAKVTEKECEYWTIIKCEHSKSIIAPYVCTLSDGSIRNTYRWAIADDIWVNNYGDFNKTEFESCFTHINDESALVPPERTIPVSEIINSLIKMRNYSKFAGVLYDPLDVAIVLNLSQEYLAAIKE